MKDKIPMNNKARQLYYTDAIVASEILKENRAWAGQAIGSLREELDMSLRDFADLIGCDYTYLSKIESGKVLPGIALIRKVQELDA